MTSLRLRKRILCVGFSFLIVSTLCHEHKYEPKYTIINDEKSDVFASYKDGLIYILSSKDEIESILPYLNENDIVVVDERQTDDPNILIIDSYRINNKDIRNTILSCILEYERLYPSEWNRTIESMRNEWVIHNISYDLNYKVDNSRTVDLNNEDEDKYKAYILKKIFFN